MTAQTANLTLEQELRRLGYGHRQLPHSRNTGKHAVFRLDTGKVVGEWDAHEAADFLAGLTAEAA